MVHRCLFSIFTLLLVTFTNRAACGGLVKKLCALLDQEVFDKIDALQKEIENLKIKQISSDKKIEELAGKLDRDDNNPVIAFSARVKPSYQNIAPWATIRFSDVVTNIGEAYNAATGEFTAPQSGVYVFYSNILSGPKIIETSLQINGENKLWLYSAGTPHFGSGSNVLITHLKEGDKVKMVKHGPWGTRPFYVHHRWSTFSGYLLSTNE